jgi:hypothetical protein
MDIEVQASRNFRRSLSRDPLVRPVLCHSDSEARVASRV